MLAAYMHQDAKVDV